MPRKHPSSVFKQPACVLRGQEKTSHPEDATRRRQGHEHDHLRRPCGRPPAGLPAVQSITGQIPSRHQSHHRHRLHGLAETARSHHLAKKAQEEASLAQTRQVGQPPNLGDRVPAEHVIGAVKRFKIASNRYRNRRKRFSLLFAIIATSYNKDVTP